MSKGKIKTTKAKSGGDEIVWIGDEPSDAVEKHNGPGDSRIILGAPDILSAHLCFTAPDRHMFYLSMDGLEFQEGSCELYRGLEPKNTSEAMMATLAVGLFNTGLVCMADGTRQNTPPHIRDLNLRNGIKAATAVADLLERLHDFRSGGQKSVSVGNVNVEAGGQAIVGNVQPGREREEADGEVQTTLRSLKGKAKG